MSSKQKFDWEVEPTRAPSERMDWEAQPEEGRSPDVQADGHKEGLMDLFGRMLAPSDLSGKKINFMGREIELPKDVPGEKRTPIEPSVGKNLGYLGGVLSTAAIQGLRFKDKQFAGDPEEMKQALKGYAKSPVQQLEEAGTPGFLAAPMGIGASIATDPMLGFMDMKAPLSEVASSVGKGVQKKLYRNALKDVDTTFAKKKAYTYKQDATPFTDQVIEDGIFKAGMSPMEMAQASTNKMKGADGLGDQFNELWKTHRKMRIPPAQVAEQPMFREFVAEKIPFPGNQKALRKVHDAIEADHVKFFSRDGGASPDEITELARIATRIAEGKQLANGDIYGRWSRDSTFKEGMAAYAQSLRDLRDKMIAQVDPAAGEQLAKLRKDYGVYAAADKPMNMMASKYARQKDATQMEGAMTSIGKLDALKALIGKLSVKYKNTPSGAVRLGNTARAVGDMGIWKLGDNPVWQRILRQGMQGRFDDGKE